MYYVIIVLLLMSCRLLEGFKLINAKCECIFEIQFSNFRISSYSKTIVSFHCIEFDKTLI